MIRFLSLFFRQLKWYYSNTLWKQIDRKTIYRQDFECIVISLSNSKPSWDFEWYVQGSGERERAGETWWKCCLDLRQPWSHYTSWRINVYICVHLLVCDFSFRFFRISLVFTCDYWSKPSVTHFHPSFSVRSLLRSAFVLILLSFFFFDFFVVNSIVSECMHACDFTCLCSSSFFLYIYFTNWTKK